MSPEPINCTFVSNISVEESNSANWSFSNGSSGEIRREGGFPNPPRVDQSDSTTYVEQTPVVVDEILTPSYKDVSGCSAREGVIRVTSNLGQSPLSLVLRNLPPLKWCSLTENSDQSRSCSRQVIRRTRDA